MTYYLHVYFIGFGGSELYWIITIRYVVAKRMSCKKRKLNVFIILLLSMSEYTLTFNILIGRYLLREKMINLLKKNHSPKL